jgi:uncharacterized protein YfaS (alpha-2-macroglobulin family)
LGSSKEKLVPITTEVVVKNQFVSQLETDFELDESDRDIVKYTGQISLLLEEDFQRIKDATKLKVKNKIINLNWEKLDGKTFKFVSDNLKRDDVSKPIDFRIDKKILNLDEDVVRSSNLYSLHEMAVSYVKKTDDQVNPGIEIVFSDLLDSNQDIRKYIKVKSNDSYKIQRFENKIVLNGGFEFGKKYDITIVNGIKNRFEQKLSADFKKTIAFNDQLPKIMFIHDGSFLPSSNEKKVQFRTLNVNNVKISVSKVYENNLIYFLQNNSYKSRKYNSDSYINWGRYYSNQIYDKDHPCGGKKNEWIDQEIDLSKVITDNQGLYFIKLEFREDDINYKGVTEYGNRYNNPKNRYYYYNNGTISKSIVISDIGVTAKKHSNGYQVYVTNVLNAKTITGAKVYLKTFQNQIIAEDVTNNKGIANFGKSKEDSYFIEVHYKGQRSVLKLDEMKLETSKFDVDGVQYSSNKTRAYIYTERGVYRPGDEINLSMILRNKDNTFPKNHPVKISLKNPRGQKVFDRVLKDGIDGFYNLKFNTEVTDLTGDWGISVKAGNSYFHHNLKIETVVAERLKIDIKPGKEVVSHKDKSLKVDLNAKYLFGAPASDLNAKIKTEYIPINRTFKEYKAFSFTNNNFELSDTRSHIVSQLLDKEGNTSFNIALPNSIRPASGILLKLNSEVFEKGGRSSKKEKYIEYNYYPAYVGIDLNSDRWVKPGKELDIRSILLNPDGTPLPNKNLIVKVYHNRSYWWWEYNSYDYNRRNFKKAALTELVYQTTLTSSMEAQKINFKPEKSGQYLIEIIHEKDNGKYHSCSKYFRSSRWGNPRSTAQNAGMIEISLDKQKYNIGDEVEVSFPTPKSGNILVSLEKGDQILQTWWKKPSGKEVTSIKFKAKPEMNPNCYISVSVIQPQSQTNNDRPLRMFGIIPITVMDNKTVEHITLETPDVIRPNQNFKCKIKTDKKTQFTIAVVDEGLLSLTDFKTPNPWDFYNQKQKLDIITIDNLGYIIGANKGDIFRTHSIGGGISLEDLRKDNLAPENAKRFKPVSMFKGPLFTDDNGYAEVEFKMPSYMGAVRIMVVTADKKRYGHAEKTVEVKDDVVVLPTIPRILAPEDKFILPVEFFATKENIGNVNVSLETSDFIEIMGAQSQIVTFDNIEQKSLQFSLKVKKAVGLATIKLISEYSGGKAVNEVEIDVRALSSRIYKSEEKQSVDGAPQTFLIPDDGIDGTNKASIIIKKLPIPDLGKRINWLINYPYGCIEQTTSAVFPQLYLSEFVEKNADLSESTLNISDGLKRLNKFQMVDGSFSYWPGGNYTSLWGTNYAGHFMLEAKEAGYHVPQELIDNWVRYQKTAINKYKYRKYETYKLRSHIYSMYLLAKAGKADVGALNFAREKYFKYCDDSMRWMMAAAYKLAGAENEAKRIVSKTGVLTKDYIEHSGTYGSALRDKAMILEAMLNFDESEDMLKVYKNIAEEVSGKNWFSTQTAGYSLLALGKYIRKSNVDKDQKLSGRIIEGNGKVHKFNSSDMVMNFNLENSIGKEVKIEFDKSDIKNVFITSEWSGVPLRSSTQKESNGLIVNRRIIGNARNDFKQGSTLEIEIDVENLEKTKLENIALVQLLPSGWEIVNERLKDDNNGNYGVSSYDYIDIRDDRLMWFFDLNTRSKKVFKFKVNVVTVGEFYLPATNCEAMYDHRYRATDPGMKVKVVK